MAQDGRGRLHMTDNEQIVADLVWSEVEKPEGTIFTIAHNVFDDKYRVNCFVRVWRGLEGDLPGQAIGWSGMVKYDRDSHTMTILRQTGQTDHKGLLKNPPKKSGDTHTFTAREESTENGANFSLRK